MEGYKAFTKGLVCRDKQYAENTVFEENTEICSKGMHFCKNPLDVFEYYPLVDKKGNITEFAEVEALDNAETDDGKQFCTKKLKIGSKLSLSQFIEASFDFAYQNIESQAEASDGETLVGSTYAKFVGGNHAELVGDDCAKLVGGEAAILVGGIDATAVGGNYATVVGQYCAKLVGGDCAKLIGDAGATVVGGNFAELVGGDCTTLTGGYSAKLVGGDCAKLVGDASAILVGGDGAILTGGSGATLTGGTYAKLIGDYNTTLTGGSDAIIVGDHNSVAKGKKGSIIVLVERDSNLNIVDFKAVQVDGKKIKEDVLYKLENGELIQV